MKGNLIRKIKSEVTKYNMLGAALNLVGIKADILTEPEKITAILAAVDDGTREAKKVNIDKNGIMVEANGGAGSIEERVGDLEEVVNGLQTKVNILAEAYAKLADQLKIPKVEEN
jgi:hypothetical protein